MVISEGYAGVIPSSFDEHAWKVSVIWMLLDLVDILEGNSDSGSLEVTRSGRNTWRKFWLVVL